MLKPLQVGGAEHPQFFFMFGLPEVFALLTYTLGEGFSLLLTCMRYCTCHQCVDRATGLHATSPDIDFALQHVCFMYNYEYSK